MKKIIVLPLLFGFLIVGVGCASKAKKEVGSSAVGIKWETKAQVRDFKNNKNSNLNIDIISVKNSHLRMEVTATLGYPVATFIATPQNLKMAVYPQKKFYFGPNSEEALRPMLGFPLDPNVFQSIVYDTAIKGWSCVAGDDGLVASCKRMTKSGEVVVVWQERKETNKRVVIHGPQFEMQWLFQASTILNPVKSDAFKLEAPSGYTVVPL